MRQFTTPEQTDKLIELGFEKPKGWCAEGISSHLHMYKRREDDEGLNYSIGELIQMLPPKLGGHHLSIERYIEFGQWIVCYEINRDGSIAPELCDALYNMIVKMKEYKMI